MYDYAIANRTYDNYFYVGPISDSVIERMLHQPRDKDMPNYRRAFILGGTWFFTVNLLQRYNNDLLIREIDLLRQTVQQVKRKHPFHIDAWVVLPDHIHCVWTLPPDDSNFSLRWRLI